jgi:hypothetical protein
VQQITNEKERRANHPSRSMIPADRRWRLPGLSVRLRPAEHHVRSAAMTAMNICGAQRLAAPESRLAAARESWRRCSRRPRGRRAAHPRGQPTWAGRPAQEASRHGRDARCRGLGCLSSPAAHERSPRVEGPDRSGRRREESEALYPSWLRPTVPSMRPRPAGSSGAGGVPPELLPPRRDECE